MSMIYGAEHLLRMLGAASLSYSLMYHICSLISVGTVNLPQMVAQTNLDPESVNVIRDYSNELMQ